LHMSKLRPGRALSLPRGRWCAPGRRLPSGRHPPLFRGQSLRPRWIIPSAGGTSTRRQREFTRFTHHPGNRLAASPEPGTPAGSRRSSPRPPPPDGTRPASAFTPGFAPRSYPRRTPERRQALAHWPGYYTLDISRTSKRCLPLDSSTLTSHVVRGGLQRHHLDAVLLQLAAQRTDGFHPRLDRPHVAAPGAGPGRVRGAGAHHPGVLRHVDRGNPVMDPLVFLIVNHLRSAHRGLLCLVHGIRRAVRGSRSAGTRPGILTGVLKATVRDPQVRTPAPGWLTGSRPKNTRRHGQPAPTIPPARPHRTNPSGTRQRPPARRDPHPPGFSRDATFPRG